MLPRRGIGILAGAAMAGMALTAAPAGAATVTVVDTGTPTGPSVYSVHYYDAQSYNWLAARFTLSQATRITQVQSYLSRPFAGSGDIIFSLHSDRPWGVGAVVASQVVRISALAGAPAFDWFGTGFGSGVDLAAGNWWVSMTTATSGAGRYDGSALAFNTPSIPVGAYQNNFTGGRWNVRDQSFGLRIAGVTAGVPEPATWAMMVMGIGLVGAGMRRRTVAVRHAA